MPRILFRLAAILLYAAAQAPAAERWIRLTTPHFELYTTAGEKKAREAILYFEEVRTFFMLSSPAKKAPEFPVRIVAFRSEKEYKPYRVNEFAAAFYTRDENRDYIVMQDIAPEFYPVAIHEYTHLVLEHSGLHVPLWMNEGWADLYSTLKPAKAGAMIGELIPGRVRVLMGSAWIPLTELGSVGNKSGMYNEKDKAGIFYAESWAFMHMLYLAPDYAPHFSAFVMAVAAGKSLPDACQQALGKTVAEVQTDLEQYLRRNQLFAALFDVKLSRPEAQPEIGEVSEFQSGLVLADLLAMTHRMTEAKAAYDGLAASNPNRPELEESVGYWSWKMGDRAGAREQFLRAMAHGSRSAGMCYRLAMLSYETRSNGDDVMRALKRAVEIKPDYVEARLQLAYALLDAGNYQACLDQLHQVKKVSEENAPRYFTASAYASAQLGRDADARKSAESARKWAKTPEQINQLEGVLRFLNSKKR